jgi:DNA primase
MANSTIEEIKERLSIVDVVSSYISTKKAGTNYKANCPFHKEKSASLMISPSKQIWHCFGCGEGGDVFGFVMKYENMDFPEALKILAERAGVQLPKFTREDAAEDKRKEILLRANDLAAKFYHKVLMESSVAEPARKYLAERGLQAATLKEWQIGFAPEDFHVLENFLLKKGFVENDLLAAGLSSRRAEAEAQAKPGFASRIFDRFVKRITFPIRNYAGDVVGFTARIVEADAKAAKYINTSETLVYNKSKIIFGLYQAKQFIRKEDFAIVVEGNMDVVAAHQAGFKNVVASSGTAFTFEQLEILSRLTKNLKFAFDTDQAGLAATRRALDSALALGFSVFIVKIEGAKDPDELIKKDPTLFAKAVAAAPLYLDYFFEKSFENYEPNSIQQKKQIVSELMPLLQKLTDPLEVNHYVRILAQRLGTTEKTIYEILAQSKTSFRPQKNESAKPLLKSRSFFLEEKILGYALFKDKYRKELFESLAPQEIADSRVRRVFENLKISENGAKIDDFITAQGENKELAKMALFMIESEYSDSTDADAFEREFHKIFKEFKNNSTKIEMSTLLSEMVLAEQKKDKAQLALLNEKFLELSKALKEYTL